LVITQPDKPVGRKKVLTPSPVKTLAQSFEIPTETPNSLKNYQIPPGSPALAVVAQYGKIIPESILNSFSMGVINVHTSLLPKYRGASPIQSAIVNGGTQTGVTIMLMDVGMDTGPILSYETLRILPDDTYPEVDQKLANIGSELLLQTLPKVLDGTITPQKQNDSEATACKMLSREDGKIHWDTMKANHIYNLYRGLTPWPGVWTTLDGLRLKLHKITPSEKGIPAGVLLFEDGKIYVGAMEGSIEILDLQLEGKPSMNAQTFINGFQKYNHAHLI